MKLVVTIAFGEFAVGAQITDDKACAAALADHPEKVVQVADDQPQRSKKPDKPE